MSSTLLLQRVTELAKHRNTAIATATLVGLFSCRWLNSWLANRVHNNYVNDRTWDWAKEVVFLTGGSSGIGAVIAAKLAEKNVKVIIVDLHPPQGKLAPNQFFYKLDITSSDDVKAVAAEIRSQHGDPTVLINNAGIGNAKSIFAVPESAIRKIFEVNIISHFTLIQEFLPAMVRADHGHVVTLASLASFSTQATNVDYACTKVATLAFHEGLGQELKHVYKAPRVRTTVVHPTWVRTPMIAKLIASSQFNDTVVTAEDVANAIVQQLYLGRGAQLVVPSTLGWVSAIRGFPLWLQMNMRDQISMSLLRATELMKP